MNEGKVVNNITNIYKRRVAALYALSLKYAGLAINYFRAQQATGAYWSNKTGQARDRMFSNAFIEGNVVGWFLSHGVEYGPWLELANDGRRQAIRPVINKFAPLFFADAQRIFKDVA